MNTFITPRENDAENANVAIFVYISEATMEISEEFLVYDEESLLGDVGGMVGVLMGVSILAIYETVFNFVSNMAGKVVKTAG